MPPRPRIITQRAMSVVLLRSRPSERSSSSGRSEGRYECSEHVLAGYARSGGADRQAGRRDTAAPGVRNIRAWDDHGPRAEVRVLRWSWRGARADETEDTRREESDSPRDTSMTVFSRLRL